MPWLSRRPPGSSRPARVLGVDLDLGGADVLDHADAGDRVEALAAAGEVAVVHHPDLDPVGDAGLLGPLPRLLGLGRGEGDADDAGAVLGRRPEREAAPAAADVEHPVALLQLQLAGDRLQLLLLRLLQRLARRARRSRSCRPSSGRGRARRTRWRRRSGGARRGRRAPCCGGGRSGAAPPRAARGGRVRPAARTAPSSSARLSAPSSGGGCQPSSSSITASMSSTSISPLT